MWGTIGNGLGSIFGQKKKSGMQVFNPSNGGGYEQAYATVTSDDGKTRSISENEYNNLISSKTNQGNIGILDNKDSGFGLGSIDFVDLTKGASNIAGIYYGKKAMDANDENLKMQKDQADYLKSRDAMADAKIAQIQSNYDQTR